MNVFDRVDDLVSVPGPLVIAAGVFDGVHRGHCAVLQMAIDMASKMGGSAVALTFDPHPSKILRPEQAVRLLTSTPHKIGLMRDFGIQHVLMIPFDKKFAALGAEEFLASLSCAAPSRVRRICVGQGWRFGARRHGDVNLLRALGVEYGFETTEVSAVTIEGALVSSTLIRQAVETGDLDHAELLLGRRYSILGTVQHGSGLGRQIGFPTANLVAHSEQFPPDGVYMIRACFGNRLFSGIANIGVRPTVISDGKRLLEVHLFDFSEDLYECDVEVSFMKFLRPEKKFSDIDSLRCQIFLDIESARSLSRSP